MQRDLATLIRAGGAVHALGASLRSGAEPDSTDASRGMRHRSARAWSADHPDALVVVVSADGPVTTYHAGQTITQGRP
jgi:DNA integrity scanning protein DisA with diadenylate cyclase activity